MISFTLTDEQRDLQALAHDFAANELRPIAAECDRCRHVPTRAAGEGRRARPDVARHPGGVRRRRRRCRHGGAHRRGALVGLRRPRGHDRSHDVRGWPANPLRDGEAAAPSTSRGSPRRTAAWPPSPSRSRRPVPTSRRSAPPPPATVTRTSSRREVLHHERRRRGDHDRVREARRGDHRVPAGAGRSGRLRRAARRRSSGCAPPTRARSCSTTPGSPLTGCWERRDRASRSRWTSSRPRGPRLAHPRSASRGRRSSTPPTMRASARPSGSRSSRSKASRSSSPTWRWRSRPRACWSGGRAQRSTRGRTPASWAPTPRPLQEMPRCAPPPRPYRSSAVPESWTITPWRSGSATRK